VARSTVLLATERWLQKKCSPIEGVVALWIRLKAGNTEKIKRDKCSDLTSVRLGDSVDTYVDKIRDIVDSTWLRQRIRSQTANMPSISSTGEDWNMFKRLICSRTGTESVQEDPSTLITLMVDREAVFRKKHGSEAVIFSRKTKKSKKDRQGAFEKDIECYG
jgi:hypothetical protein